MALQDKAPIFIVEDDEVWAATLTGKLAKDYTVHHFASGEEALEKLAEVQPVLIIQDYHLDQGGGRLTGLETMQQVKSMAPNTYVVMFSAQTEVETALAAFENGAFDYVMKQNKDALHRLSVIIRNIEEQRQMQQEFVELNVRVKRDRFWVYMVVVLILVMSSAIYLNTCPNSRPISWDPFNIQSKGRCNLKEDGSGMPKDSLQTQPAPIEEVTPDTTQQP